MLTNRCHSVCISKVGTAIEVLQLCPELIQHILMRGLIHMTKQIVPCLEE